MQNRRYLQFMGSGRLHAGTKIWWTVHQARIS